MVFAGTLMKPELKPPCKGVQGFVNEDWETVWLPGEPVNWKEITLPFVALNVGGINWKTPPAALAVDPT